MDIITNFVAPYYIFFSLSLHVASPFQARFSYFLPHVCHTYPGSYFFIPDLLNPLYSHHTSQHYHVCSILQVLFGLSQCPCLTSIHKKRSEDDSVINTIYRPNCVTYLFADFATAVSPTYPALATEPRQPSTWLTEWHKQREDNYKKWRTSAPRLSTDLDNYNRESNLSAALAQYNIPTTSVYWSGEGYISGWSIG